MSHCQCARTTTSLPNCSRRTCCGETAGVMSTPLVHHVITVNNRPQILPEQCRIQVTGVKVTLDPSLPAPIQLTGFTALQWRSVFIYPLAAPLGKCWKTPRLLFFNANAQTLGVKQFWRDCETAEFPYQQSCIVPLD